MKLDAAFGHFAHRTATAAGSPWAFGVCVVMVIAWALTGPLFQFSQTWQLVINTGTTIITFLMVFLIQNTQNRDGRAIQTKLDELILTSDAENSFVGIEKLTDAELKKLQARCERAAKAHDRLAERAAAEITARSSARETRRRRPARKA